MFVPSKTVLPANPDNLALNQEKRERTEARDLHADHVVVVDLPAKVVITRDTRTPEVPDKEATDKVPDKETDKALADNLVKTTTEVPDKVVTDKVLKEATDKVLKVVTDKALKEEIDKVLVPREEALPVVTDPHNASKISTHLQQNSH